MAFLTDIIKNKTSQQPGADTTPQIPEEWLESEGFLGRAMRKVAGVPPPEKLDDVLADINLKLYEEYQRVGVPAEERLFKQLDVDTTKDAMRDAIKSRRLLGQIDERNKSRFGVTQNVAQRGASRRADRLSAVTAEAEAGNTARLADQDTRMRTLETLINQGTGLRNAAQQGLGVAAQNEQARDAAHQAAKEGQQARLMNTASMIGLGALLI